MPVFQSWPLGTVRQRAALPPPAEPPATRQQRGCRSPVHGRTHRRGQTALLGAGDQVVDQHTQATAAPPECRYFGGQMVYPVQTLDHNTLHPEVVAPDPLDQRGVVDPLTRIRLARRPEPVAGDRHRTGCVREAVVDTTRGLAQRVATRPPVVKAPGSKWNIRTRPGFWIAAFTALALSPTTRP